LKKSNRFISRLRWGVDEKTGYLLTLKHNNCYGFGKVF